MPDGPGVREIVGSSRGSARVRTTPTIPARARAVLGLACVSIGLTCSIGCSGRGNFLTGGPTQGQLKASLAHVELENQQLKKQVAQLKTDNRSFEDRLVREELNNGDLTARLDNARNLLRGRGIELDDKPRTASNGRRNSFDEDEEDDLNSFGSGSRQTIPAGQRSSKARKPPFARIPGRIEGTTDEEDIRDDDAVSSRRPTWSPGGQQRTSKSSSRRPSGDLIDDQALREDQLRWTSIGDSSTKGQTTKR